MRKEKIFLFIESYNGYGAEKMLLWLGNGLVNNGFDVTFCSVFDHSRNPQMDDKAHFIGLGIKKYTNPIILNLCYYVIGFVKLLCCFCKTRYDVFISFRATPFSLLYLCKFFIYRAKYIMAERNDPNAATTKISKLKQRIYCKADGLVFQTDGARDYFSDDVKNKSTVIANPIVLPEDKWEYKATRHIASVGRVRIEQKRQDVAIKAMKILQDKGLDYVLDFYGDGIDLEKMKRLVDKLNLSNNVFFHGKVSNVKEKLLSSDLFILTSDYEGIPNALMEAMSLGLPVISTDCSPGGARFLIKDGVNGILIPCGNPDILASSIEDLLSSPDRMISLGGSAKTKMADYTPSNILASWIAFIKNIVTK